MAAALKRAGGLSGGDEPLSGLPGRRRLPFRAGFALLGGGAIGAGGEVLERLVRAEALNRVGTGGADLGGEGAAAVLGGADAGGGPGQAAALSRRGTGAPSAWS